MSQTQRQIQDAVESVYTLHPAQNANLNSASLDLRMAGNVAREQFEVLITFDAAPNLASAQTLTLTLQDSADNITFANVTNVSTVVQTGGSSGAALATARIALPSTIRRYIAFNDAASATAGSNTANGFTFQLVF